MHVATLQVVTDDLIVVKQGWQAVAQFELMCDNVVVFKCITFHKLLLGM
jgi:hypothetical protein